jgi:hypothetical protein
MVETVADSQKSISLANFDRHNRKTTKNPAITANRVAKHRSGNGTDVSTALPNYGKCNAPSVTSALPREEKRRDTISVYKPDDLDSSLWDAWLKVRKTKKLPLPTKNPDTEHPLSAHGRITEESRPEQGNGTGNKEHGCPICRYRDMCGSPVCD